MKNSILFIALQLIFFQVIAQPSSTILDRLERFNSFKTVLYLAAHPDDENTRVISWLVNGEHARTAYLSLTRGDGGQNLIGKEFGDDLGILRTQELLAARRIDGGEQFFTRAVDFGYSRSATETLQKWDEESILGDVVWVIRKYQPQIILTRFPPDERAGHGHHTASAMLAVKAFSAAADPNMFPEQLKFVSTYQVQSVYWNTHTWWDKTLEDDMKTDNSIWQTDIGGYNPLTGKSHNELGSLARSQHKCQGFGVAIDRGEQYEYFRLLAGKALPNGLQDLEHSNWDELNQDEIGEMVNELIANFNPVNPEKSITALADLYMALNKVENEYWRIRKQKECTELIVACAGLHAEALADRYIYQPGENAKITVNLLSRQSDELSIDGMYCGEAGISFKMPAALQRNKELSLDIEAPMPAQESNPYWLQKPHTEMYDVDNLNLIGKPENDAVLIASTSLLINGIAVPLKIPVFYKWRDRVEGEMHRNLIVAPPVAINFSEPMYVSVNDGEIEVNVSVTWLSDNGSHKISFEAEGWQIDQPNWELTNGTFEKEEWLNFKMKPLAGEKSKTLKAMLGNDQANAFVDINYDHINQQVYMPLASAKLAYLNIQKVGEKVAYIKGAGDQVDLGIAQMGYRVDMLDENSISSADLKQYQAVVIGIRAYNTLPWLPNYQSKFMSYVQQGGNMIVQYNTASRFDADQKVVGPYPFKIGRGRVTEEDAKVDILIKKHPIFSIPNRISKKDFNDWVQERGLYFASEWDENYDALLSWNDVNEEPEIGGLIVANYGNGAYIYTGISFFRQLPAGVPGAFRLLANLISYEPKN